MNCEVKTMYFKLDIISKKLQNTYFVRTDVASGNTLLASRGGGQTIICMKLSDRSLGPHGAELL